MRLRCFNYYSRSFARVLVLSFGLIYSVQAQELVQDTDFTFYEPDLFFEQFASPYFQEIEAMNPQRIEEFRGLIEFLKFNGIPIGIGTNSNTQTIFELYLPTIVRADNLDGPVVGVSPDSSVGNVYFPMHDAVHHYVGIPGVRRKDLSDKAAAREKLINVFLLKEQVATVSSLADYIRLYWNWRDEQRYGHVRDEFVDLNQGAYSVGPISRSDYVDLIGHFVFGRVGPYAKLIYKNYSSKQTARARLKGVPLPIFDLSRIIGTRLEAELYRFIFPPLAAIVGYYGEVGHVGFMKYSEAMADFMLQQWYVDWSDDFKIGYELDELEQRALDSLEQMKRDEPLGDGTVATSFDYLRNRLKHEVAYFGRRVAELRELARRDQSRAGVNTEDQSDLLMLYRDALSLYQSIDTSPKPEEIADYLNAERLQFEFLMQRAEDRFPIETYIPLASRLPHIQYNNYWRDMTALAIPRYGHNSNGVSPGGIRKWLMRKRRAESSLLAKVSAGVETLILNKVRGISSFTRRMNKLSDDYERAQKEGIALTPTDPSVTNGISSYKALMTNLSRKIGFQIRHVVYPQIVENESWSREFKKSFYDLADSLVLGIQDDIDRLVSIYEKTFIEGEGSSADFHRREIWLNIKLDEFFAGLADLVLAAQHDKPEGKAGALLSEFSELRASFVEDRYHETSRSRSRFISQILPVSSQRLFALPTVVKRLLPGQRATGFFEDIFNLPARIFHRMKTRNEVRISNLPKDTAEEGVFVLAVNHESGIYDATAAQEALRKMGVTEFIILASKEAFPSFKRQNYRDPTVVISESQNPLEEIMRRVRESSSKKVGIIICPEGNMPSPYAFMPLAAKPGAFVLARRLAHGLSSEREVFFQSGTLNGLEHLTSEKAVPLEMELLDPELVPSSPVSRDDEWVKTRRAEFENLANLHRDVKMIDLVAPRRSKESGAFVSAPLREYISFKDWYSNHALGRCALEISAISEI